jgi:hypothetical protein
VAGQQAAQNHRFPGRTQHRVADTLEGTNFPHHLGTRHQQVMERIVDTVDPGAQVL